ncbi:MAG TPA: YiiX family permuted papain-like enzyme [Candidatus Kapabacteria bacterium]|nr:YiiX family permuted papain-like enzyme [Candidatus Kapabacteria bacterium]
MLRSLSLTLVLSFLTSCAASQLPELREGDILFQSLETSQSTAIALATKSEFTHCGILLKKGDEMMVYEAVGPVKYTPIEKWIRAGNDGRVVVRRLKDIKLEERDLRHLREEAAPFLGKRYDFAFNWSDEEIYCSELVWKIYKEATNIDLGIPRAMREFDLSSPEVQRIMKQRYGNSIPYDERIISPQQVFESEHLETVFEN